MPDNYKLNTHPRAREDAVVAGSCYRFTVLTDSLIRMEYQLEGRFTDEATQTVICRDFPVPAFRTVDREDRLEIITEKLHLYYDKKPFSREGLSVQLREGFHSHGSRWHYGDRIRDLKGTVRTLDAVNGETELEGGLMSRDGFTVLDDSRSALLTQEQWIEPRKCECVDL